MYRFTIDGENFKANWKYTWEQVTTKKVVRGFVDTYVTERTVRKYQSTRCNIYTEKGELCSEGYSMCNRKDEFNKKTGRKLSFHRALENMGLTKDQRQRIMEEYLYGRNTSNGITA